eukprot:CAMPEP_0202700776 /NCGR_PEP_ID=MMETSP1385-20130828/13944_1 /ASSEMBLY_ACC=CAM_ASM_000861 /TAXON_ID=933848 /ORGANISM="Elphidium margaritaceum" /LENGTH=215 /DNA_ID=CAMNT_0049358041 /DNA_START=20 /DNA_END=663 /DNA_ORIENTATION=-
MSYLFPVQCKTHSDLIDYLSDEHLITDDSLRRAFLKVDRSDFTRFNPYADAAMYIGYNCTISSPSLHAHALRELCLSLKRAKRALDIGCGSGYLLPVMAYLMGRDAKVIGIEHIKELCALSRNNIKKHHKKLLQTQRIEIIHWDGRNGYLRQAPYDCIHVGAATSLHTVNVLLSQLNNNGRMVLPVMLDADDNDENQKQMMRVYSKNEHGQVSFT